jgi:hypothetical protein
VTGASTSSTVKAPSGESAWLGASTGFGQEFGATRSQPYLYLSTAAGQAPSVTALDFAADTPAGWGFALGDVDADWVFVQAWQDTARTQPVTPAQLGFRGAGNYCTNVPKPSSCASGPFTDAPVWVTSPESFDGINYVPGTLRGNSLPGAPAASLDTAGAYGWFTPTVPIRSIEFMFGARDGFPIVQLWLAALAPTTTITGVVEIPDAAGEPIPPATIQLNNEDSTPVLDIEDKPVVVPVGPDGRFDLETEQRGFYEIAVIAPPGYTAPDPVLVAADQPAVTAPPQTVERIVTTPTPTPTPTLTQTPTPSPTPTPSADPTSTPSSSPTPAALPATPLAATGVSTEPWLIGAGVLLALGIVAFVVSRLGRRRVGGEAEESAEMTSETPENPKQGDSISPDGRW